MYCTLFNTWVDVGMARLGDAAERMCVRGINFAAEDAGVEVFFNELEYNNNEIIGFCVLEFALKLVRASEDSSLQSMYEK